MTPVDDRKDVRFRYDGSPTEVLKGVNVSFKRGSYNVLCGLSGSGKTTLINLIYAIDSNKSYYFAKRNKDEELMRLALLFQNFGPSTMDAVQQLQLIQKDLNVFSRKQM